MRSKCTAETWLILRNSKPSSESRWAYNKLTVVSFWTPVCKHLCDWNKKIRNRDVTLQTSAYCLWLVKQMTANRRRYKISSVHVVSEIFRLKFQSSFAGVTVINKMAPEKRRRLSSKARSRLLTLTCVTQDKPRTNMTKQTASTTASRHLCRCPGYCSIIAAATTSTCPNYWIKITSANETRIIALLTTTRLWFCSTFCRIWF